MDLFQWYFLFESGPSRDTFEYLLKLQHLAFLYFFLYFIRAPQQSRYHRPRQVPVLNFYNISDSRKSIVKIPVLTKNYLTSFPII